MKRCIALRRKRAVSEDDSGELSIDEMIAFIES